MLGTEGMKRKVPFLLSTLVKPLLAPGHDPEILEATNCAMMRHMAGEPLLVIEARDASAFEKETIPGAIHIPFANLQEALNDIPKDRTLVFT